MAEKGVMTFMTHYGQTVMRPFIMWYIEGAGKHILVDTAIEMQDFRNYHSAFKDLSMDALMGFEDEIFKIIPSMVKRINVAL